jgi:hypothetical protein
MVIKPSGQSSGEGKPYWIRESKKALRVAEAVLNQENTDDLLEKLFWKDFEASLGKLGKIFNDYIQGSTNSKILEKKIENWKIENGQLLFTGITKRDVRIALRFEEFALEQLNKYKLDDESLKELRADAIFQVIASLLPNINILKAFEDQFHKKEISILKTILEDRFKQKNFKKIEEIFSKLRSEKTFNALFGLLKQDLQTQFIDQGHMKRVIRSNLNIFESLLDEIDEDDDEDETQDLSLFEMEQDTDSTLNKLESYQKFLLSKLNSLPLKKISEELIRNLFDLPSTIFNCINQAQEGFRKTLIDRIDYSLLKQTLEDFQKRIDENLKKGFSQLAFESQKHLNSFLEALGSFTDHKKPYKLFKTAFENLKTLSQSKSSQLAFQLLKSYSSQEITLPFQTFKFLFKFLSSKDTNTVDLLVRCFNKNLDIFYNNKSQKDFANKCFMALIHQSIKKKTFTGSKLLKAVLYHPKLKLDKVFKFISEGKEIPRIDHGIFDPYIEDELFQTKLINHFCNTNNIPLMRDLEPCKLKTWLEDFTRPPRVN